MPITNRVTIFPPADGERRPTITTVTTSAGPCVDVRDGTDSLSFFLKSREDVELLQQLADEARHAWEEHTGEELSPDVRVA